MHFLDIIFSIVWDISDWFYRGYLRTNDWVWPFYRIAEVFLAVSDFFWGLLTPIAHAHDWVVDITDKISQVFNLDTIKDYLKQWLDWAAWAWEWVHDAWYYVTGWIDNWWLVTQTTVKGWIDAAIQTLEGAWEDWLYFWQYTWPSWVNQFNTLRASWDEFWTVTFPNLIDTAKLYLFEHTLIGKVIDLIITAFRDRESWWAGWQDMRDRVIEFFTDPVEWLWTRFADWFLGPEE